MSITPSLSSPYSGRARGKWEMRELSFETPKVLYDAGLHFAIQTDAVKSTISFLPICAGLACREGIPYDEALKAIAINPAQIIGVGDRVGSLEKGKDADIRILSSDPFELKTKVEKVIINGELAWSRGPSS